MAEHEAVKAAGDRESLFQFFAPDKRYRVEAVFTPLPDTSVLEMKTFSNKAKRFLVYGHVEFMVRGKNCRLFLYRNRKLMEDPKHRDDLFLPFTDKTSGKESYYCRYLDFKIGDIHEGKLMIDFNFCYNPYCAYGDGWNCPIPPPENHLGIAIRAGEKNFAGTGH